MRLMSERWDDAIYSSHRMVVRVQALPSGNYISSLVGGSVTLDITALARGRVDLTFADPALTPNTTTDDLAPYGQEIRVWRGIEYADGTQELASLGIFQIQETTVNDAGPEFSIQVAGNDRSAFVSDSVLEAEGTIADGTDFKDAIEEFILDAYPSAELSFLVKSIPLPDMVYPEGTDPWAEARSIALAGGCDLYFDNDGVCQLKAIALPSAAPHAYLVEGVDGVAVNPPNLMQVSKRRSRLEAHNKWVVIGNNPNVDGAPPRGEAIDTDPSSPTYYYGTFGRKPEISYKTDCQTSTACVEAAEGKRAKEFGIAQFLDFGSLVNPALEPGDVVSITRTRAVNGATMTIADENHIIDSLTIPLTVDGSMSGQTRQTGANTSGL